METLFTLYLDQTIVMQAFILGASDKFFFPPHQWQPLHLAYKLFTAQHLQTSAKYNLNLKYTKIKNNNNNCREEDPKVTLGSSSHPPKRVINKWNSIKILWQNGKMMVPPHDPLRQPCFGNTKYDQCVSVH